MEEVTGELGTESTSFKIKLYKAYITAFDSAEGESVGITSQVKEVYHEWYWKVLNKLTFGKYFNSGYKYKVEKLWI